MKGLLLAAGRGTRFGSDKLLHRLADGTPVALAAAGNLQAALADVLVVVNGESPDFTALLEQAGLSVSVCPDAALGMGRSLAWGVAQTGDADGWLIALADMPWIKLQTIRDVAALVTGPRVIAAPEYQGRRGHPVAFGRSYREELLALSGDQGARRLLDNRSQELLLLPCADPGIHRDIDCKGDLAKVAV